MSAEDVGRAYVRGLIKGINSTDERWAEVNVLLEDVLSRKHPDPEVEALILTAHIRLKVEGER